MPNIFAIYSDS